MNSAFSSENLDWLWRSFLVQCVILILFFTSLVNFSFSMMGDVTPYFMVITIFYWAIYRPSFLQPLWIFALGILQDLVIGYPVGVHAILYLVLHYTVKNQRTFLTGQTYFVLWMIFSMVCLVFLFVEWGFFSIVSWTLFDYHPVVSSWLLTILFYPLINWIFAPLLYFLPEPDRMSLN